VNTWNSIAWFPICVGLTAAGLVLSWYIWRRRGLRPAIRVGAWSLVPLALYLTGSILLVGRIGSAVVQFASSFVFSPRAWLGVILLGISVLLFLLSGGIPLLRWRNRRNRRGSDRKPPAGAAPQPGSVSATRTQPGQPAADDDLDDVQEILRRRRIK
jgi:Ni/Fe-hydrogenase subunit HybB-like protein